MFTLGEIMRIKGGPGSGNYSGPGQPRFAREGTNNEAKHNSMRQSVFEFAKNSIDKSEIMSIVVNGETIHLMGPKGLAQVEVPDKFFSEMEYSVHNHPGSASFSGQDISLFFTCEKMKQMDVIGKDGTLYTVKKDQLEKSHMAASRKWKEIEEQRHAPFQERYNKGEAAEPLWKEETHEVMVALSKEMEFSYSRTLNVYKSLAQEIKFTEINPGEKVFVLDDTEINNPPYVRESGKKEGLSVIFKGGPGSGSWEGPGDPRFAHEGTEQIAVYHGTSSWVLDKILSEGLIQQPGSYYLYVAKTFDMAEKMAKRSDYETSDPPEHGVIFKARIQELEISSASGSVGYTVKSGKIAANDIVAYATHETKDASWSWFDTNHKPLTAVQVEKKTIANLSVFIPIVIVSEIAKSLEATITKAKPKITRKPLSKEQQEFVFRETTSKFEKKFQKTMIEYFKDQEKAALSVLKKGFDEIEQKHLQGRHDQQSHAGGTGGSGLTSDEYFYHGTVDNYALKIMREGIVPNNNRSFSGTPWEAGLYTGDRKDSVYISRSLDTAQAYALQLRDKLKLEKGKTAIPIVFKIKMNVKDFVEDEEDRSALRKKGTIPSEAIVACTTNYGDTWKEISQRKSSEDTFYVPAIVVVAAIAPNKSFSSSNLSQDQLLSGTLGLTGVFGIGPVMAGIKGGPGSGNYNGPGDPRFATDSREDIAIYHGTSSFILDKILAEGLIKQPGSLHLYVAKSFIMAAQMASRSDYEEATPPEHGVIFKARIQESAIIHASGSVGYTVVNHKIPASSIVAYATHNKLDAPWVWFDINHKLLTIEQADKKSIAENIVFVPVIIKAPQIKSLSTITKASPNALPDRFDFSGWAYKDSEWNRRLQAEGGLFIKEMYEAEGRRVWEQLALQLEDGLEGAFDIDNPLVQEFIANYGYKFAQGINETTVGMLQGAMTAGMDEGLGMDGIAKLVREVFDNCTKYRSMLIARTETIRASNGAAKMAYEQSEVVEGMEWLTTKDDLACPFCFEMNGKIVGLDENYFELGESMTVGSGANKITMKFDYEDVGYPPLHVQCRCTVVPKVYDEYLIPKSISTLHQEGLDSTQNLVLTRYSSSLKGLTGVFGLGLIFKGGPGSGSWNGPDDPRFVHERNDTTRGHVNAIASEEEKVSSVEKDTGLDKETSKRLVKAVDAYCGPSYKVIRSQANEEFTKMNDDLQTLIDQSPKWNGNGTLYRGFSASKDFVNGLEEGVLIDTKGLSSWTSLKSVAQEFSEGGVGKERVLFNLGRSDNASSIAHLSSDPTEKEVLVGGKASLRVQGLGKSKDGTTVVFLEDVGPKLTKGYSLVKSGSNATGKESVLTIQEKWKLDSDLITIIDQKKAFGLQTIFKGGPGSGSWNGPDDPRFAFDGVGENQEYYEYTSNLSENERKVVRRYTGGGFAFMNKYLRTGGKTSDNVKDQCDTLRKIINNAPALKTNIVVNRTISGDLEKLGVTKGGIYEDKGFVSTSLKKYDFNASSRSHIAVIEIDVGGKGLFVEALGGHASEKEIIFNPSKFKVIDIQPYNEYANIVYMKKIKE